MRNKLMKQAACEMRLHKQNEKESLLDHGISVAKHLWKIRKALEGQATDIFIPDIVISHRQFFLDAL